MTTASPDTRKRDLRSAVTSFAKLKGQPPAAIPLDLADIRHTLDGMVPAAGQVSRKRWANMRSDLAAAIEASGLRPMLKTADVKLDAALDPASCASRKTHPPWPFAFCPLGEPARDRSGRRRRRHDRALHRRTRAATLIRNLANLRRTVALAWNALVRCHQGAGLRPVAVPPNRAAPTRIPWQQLPASFRDDVKYTSRGRRCRTRSLKGPGQGRSHR